MWILNGNISKTEHACGSPGKSSLFFLTSECALESDYLEKGHKPWERQLTFDCSSAPPMALENSEFFKLNLN